MTTQGEQTDRQLVQAVARNGDVMAFELLLHRYQGPLYGFIRRQTGAGEADDLFQETLFRIFAKIDRCQNPDAFRAWAFGIAANICRYEGRKQLNRAETASGRLEDKRGWAPSPEASAQTSQVRDRIAEAVDRLPPAQREVFVLYQYTQLSYDEIAIAVGAPLGTVKSRMNGALTQLRTLLASLEEAQP